MGRHSGRAARSPVFGLRADFNKNFFYKKIGLKVDGAGRWPECRLLIYNVNPGAAGCDQMVANTLKLAITLLQYFSSLYRIAVNS